MKRMVEEGEPARIESKYIANFEISEWWERAHGKQKPEWVSFEPQQSSAPYPFDSRRWGRTVLRV
jgi:hypothetical protein